ncbi:hypothetical protein H9P43_007323 [Blastocladiella emersonii ATCC 22665]|nr:hypothetical protein H9P43_007323 [Blastocladiella emersonii ATCC 22665]
MVTVDFSAKPIFGMTAIMEAVLRSRDDPDGSTVPQHELNRIAHLVTRCYHAAEQAAANNKAYVTTIPPRGKSQYVAAYFIQPCSGFESFTDGGRCKVPADEPMPAAAVELARTVTSPGPHHDLVRDLDEHGLPSLHLIPAPCGTTTGVTHYNPAVRVMPSVLPGVPTVRINLVTSSHIDAYYAGLGVWDFASNKLPGHYFVVFPADTTWGAAKSVLESSLLRNYFYPGSQLCLMFGEPTGFYEERPGNLPPRRLSPRFAWRTHNVPFGAIIVAEFTGMRSVNLDLDLGVALPTTLAASYDGDTFTPSVVMQISSLLPHMTELAAHCANPGRVRATIEAAVSAYLASQALMPNMEHDLRHYYRMVARGRLAPATFLEWLERVADGTWQPEFCWLADPDAPCFPPDGRTAMVHGVVDGAVTLAEAEAHEHGEQ